MSFNTPPYLSQNNSVRRIMGQVLLALLPGVGVYAWLIGPLVLVQLAIATTTAMLSATSRNSHGSRGWTVLTGSGAAGGGA